MGILAGIAVLGAALLLLASGHLLSLRTSILSGLLSFEAGHEMPIMLLGLYRTHMTAGNQYAMAALVAICFMLRTKNPKIASMNGLVLVSLLAATILSGARTAYVAFTAAFLIQFASKRKYFRPLLKIGALVMVPSFLFFLSQPSVFNRAATIVNFEGKDNVAGRFRLYQKALEDFSDSPLIGIGFARYSDSGKTFVGVRHLIYIATSGESSTDINQIMEVHDSYLQFLAEGGLVGLFLMLGVWVSTYRWACRLRHKLKDGTNGAALCESVQVSILVTMFSSLTGTTMMMATTPLFVFALVGLLRNVVAFDCRCQARGSMKAIACTGFPVPTPVAHLTTG
ncbi:MAG TPA: O-antigen ligase family protein [Candidatus Acidoferrales bacterium]|nr:O-antigen ligase family protein [Candidatus Acidoferrales bacterium]